MSVNKVILVGRLGKDPDTRVTGSGIAVANFPLATAFTTRKSGQEVKETEWHRIVAYERQAELCRDYLRKGALIYLEGRLKTRQWEDREGNKQKTTEVIIDRLTMLGSRNNAEQKKSDQPAGSDGSNEGSAGDERDGIPF